MKKMSSPLDTETQLLVAAGSAVAAGCIPCLESIVKMAREEGIEEKKLRAAAMTGQFVKEKPNSFMKGFADELLGTHLQQPQAETAGCPLSEEESGCAQPSGTGATVDARAGGCSCS